MAVKDSSISSILGKIANGIAKPNRYTVDITLPPAMGLADPEKVKTLRILCERAEIPGALIATDEDKKFGPPRKMPYQYAYGDLTLGFICEDGMTARGFFDWWQSLIVDKTSYECYYLENYAAPEINITLLSEEGKPIYHIICYQAWPVEVVPQPIAYAENDDYLKLEVKMAYYNWDFKVGATESFTGAGDPAPAPVIINYGKLNTLIESTQRASRSFLNSIPQIIGESLGGWFQAVDSAISSTLDSVNNAIDTALDSVIDNSDDSPKNVGKNPKGRKRTPKVSKI
jgi:hypothetical protein